MKRHQFSIVMLVVLANCLNSMAQTPSWAKKAANAVFTLKTFNAEGTLLGSSTGFFVTADGEAVSSYTPFRGAQRAVIIDAQGTESTVDCIMGANEMYDVAKFRVNTKKVTALTIAAQPLAKENAVWILPYSVKKIPQCPQGTVSEAEVFQGSYTYYTLQLDASSQPVGTPLLNQNGEAVALLQQGSNAKSTTSYAISAAFATSLQLTALSINEPALRQTAIAKAIPSQLNDALLSLYVSGSSMDSAQYSDYLNRFICQFPSAPDGYIYRARQQAAQGQYALADNDMAQALKVATKKDDVHYQYAQLIYQHELYQPHSYPSWTLDRAMEESERAYRTGPTPIYLQQQAQIRFAQERYEDALQIYQQLSQTSLRSAETFYAAAQCYARLGKTEEQLAQLDSAVAMFSQPYVKTAAPYLFARAQARLEAKKFRPAVNDYNAYAELMQAQLNAQFYYLREQAEMGGHLYQQALDDIHQAIQLAPEEPLYLAECASLQLRVGRHQDAEDTARKLIEMAPDLSDGYLCLGLSQCLTNRKPEGIKNLQHAKELGNEQAQSLIEKYAQ